MLLKKALSWHEINSSHRLMILVVVVLGLLNFFWGEKIPAGGGFGFDGVRYAEMVRHLDSMVSGGQLSSYHAQRILPSAIVRSMMLLSGIAMSDLSIIRFFELYNLFLLVGACLVWKRVADNFSLGLAGRWIGFSGIFINFQCSKQAFYYPVLTDVTALFIAMLMLLFYVERKPIALFFTTIIGAFCWPVVSVCGASLLILLRAELPKEVIVPTPSTFTIKFIALPSLVKITGLAILILSIIGYLILSQIWQLSADACNALNTPLQILANLRLPVVSHALERVLTGNNACALETILNKVESFLTVLPSLFGLLLALWMLIGSGSFFKVVLSGLMRSPLSLVLLAISAILVPSIMVRIISNPAVGNPSDLMFLVKVMLFPQEGKFLLPIVTLAVFWGPVVLLLVLYWQEFCVESRKLGPGFMVVIGISLLFGLVGEPRFMTIAWPFLVLGLVLAMERSSTKGTFKYVFVVLTVLYAQFWMKLNLAPWFGADNEGLLEFPKQLFFMHYGLWMSWWSYAIQLVVLLLSIVLLHRLKSPS